jgi:COMPASS component SWD1
VDSKSFSVLREFQDVVNRVVWSSSCISGHGDYVVASSKSKHNIYIWNRTFGQLITILDCSRPGIVQLRWHPVRPLLVAVLVNGQIAIWSKNVSENWAAFAPGFVKLQENVEYEEREDEFDIVGLL